MFRYVVPPAYLFRMKSIVVPPHLVEQNIFRVHLINSTFTFTRLIGHVVFRLRYVLSKCTATLEFPVKFLTVFLLLSKTE